MVFHSLHFAAFFIIVVLGYFTVPLRARWVWLLAASVYFYGAGQPVHLLQIIAASAVTFCVALGIESAGGAKAKGRLLTLGVALLVANLFVFKYTSFVNETFRAVTGWVGLAYPVPAINILLPIGISFYTFQLISYLVDVFRGDKAERHLGNFLLYVTFFPKLVAGPIERARNLLPQLHAPKPFDYDSFTAGARLLAWGAFKKVVVADRLAPFVDVVYNNPHAYEGPSLAFATWLYAFQIYFDFSGYTDMALGAAMIMGFKLTQNFNRPYFATSIQDFWKRWHISLTSWLTDYVFNPLIRSKFIKIKWYNLMLLSMLATFLISGLWHGAQWTFVAWGALHGTYIVVGLILQKPFNQAVARIGLVKRPRLYRGLKIAFTFSLVCLAYILFRSASLADAYYVATHLPAGWSEIKSGVGNVVLLGGGYPEAALAMAGIAIVMGAEALQAMGARDLVAARPAWMRWAVYAAGGVSIVVLGAFYGGAQPFIYFRF